MQTDGGQNEHVQIRICKQMVVRTNKARIATTNKSMAGERTIRSASSHAGGFAFCGVPAIA
jgi:hypothetical protein